MTDNLFLPYPNSFAKYCIYSLNEAVPVWLNGCISNKNSLLYSDLFESNLDFINLDKPSITAINEFAMNIINIKTLLASLTLSDSDVDLETLINYEPTSKILHKNRLFVVRDLREYGLENLVKVQSLGLKKILNVLINIERFQEELLKNQINTNDENISNDEASKILEHHYQKIPLEKFYLLDPRFRAIYFKYLPKLDEDLFNFPTWKDVFISGVFFNINSKIEALLEFDSIYLKINNMTLEEQMSHFFTEHIKVSTKLGFIEKKLEGFEAIKDRFGIKKSLSKKYTIQKTADAAPIPITRERVRQIVTANLKALNSIPENEEIYIPKLTEVLNVLNENTNKSLVDISKTFSDKGYGGWSIERLFDCIDLFRVPNNLIINGDFLNDQSMLKTDNYILKIAKKISGNNGAVNVNHLHNAISQKFLVEKEYLYRVLRGAFIEIEDNWFYTETTSNHLHQLAQKMANFSMEFSIHSIREAHMKHKKCREAGLLNQKDRTFFYGFLTPPTSVIEGVINLSLNFESNDGRVNCLNLSNSFIKDKSSADSIFLQYFRARNFECANLDEMKTYFLIQNNMAEGSFFQHLSYKPYIKRLASQIYGVVGKDHDSISLEHAKNRIRRNNPTKIEWIESGLEIKLQLKNIDSAVVGMNDYIDYIRDNEFKVFHNGEEYCVLKNSSTILYGMGKYLKNVLFCELGDFILIRLNLESFEAQIELISEGDYEN